MTTSERLSDDHLARIRRRLPDIPRDDMSRTEMDRADLLAEVDRLRAEPTDAEVEAGVVLYNVGAGVVAPDVLIRTVLIAARETRP